MESSSDLVLHDEVHPTMTSINNIPGAWVLKGLLSSNEANHFISKLKFDEEIDTTANLRKDDPYKASILRKSFRFKQDLPDLASQIFSRLKKVIPSHLSFEEEDDELGPFLKGDWTFHSVNEKISFLKYGPGGVFSKHRDGIFIKNEDLRSLITVLVYLNSDFQGGRTKCFDDSEQFECEIEPIVGDAFVMIQRVLHEGGVVESGFKYAIRFDLMFLKSTEKNAEELSKNELAEKYLKIAGELERSRQGMEAVKYYQMAFKLNPKLEEML
jgi:hypothetical protein